ncbi:UDP-glucose 4-epimerase [Desulfitobacterium sp. LBE]|uniref:NAD-dependent epimerase/dehydratase family protein n=1 Tax=Desulfitobacterium sp. LBE TaxID=884086 RepID=UPI001199A577|nr:NAD(P)-dependent oxidoreductase [Desulfitobacterium sp. LBE]TWH59727.1 UDP-glucose 4-epimerase [Desulfitobacterium sp. LBE]
MRILVTGANGFIGSHLTRTLEAKGHEVMSHTSKNGDITEKNALDSFNDIEHVYHLAARTFVPGSWDNTHDYFRTNIMGTITALEFCRNNNCSITMMSTYVYGEPKYLPVDEKHPVVAVSPYHKSKITCEEICAFYSEKFGVRVTVLRPFNVYGKGQSEAFLVPKIYSQVVNDSVKEISIMDLEPKRDYVYIDDVIDALIATLNATKLLAFYNVGSGTSTSVEDVILSTFQAAGISKPYRSTNEKRFSEISDCIADISSIHADLGFVPRFTLLEGLRAWYEEK